MSRRVRWLLPVLAVLACLPARAASAQVVFESVGERALGMGGAFVAVADDATAAYWNPAGFGTKLGGSITIGWSQFQSGNQQAPPDPGPARRSGTFTSLGGTPFAISFAQLHATAITGRTLGAPVAESLNVSQYGVTVLQTLAQGLVAGTTLKYLRGDALSSAVSASTVDGALSSFDNAHGATKSALDLDVGLMATFGRVVRAGLTLKNLRQPSFGAVADPANTLQRQSRAGLAFLPSSGLTLAMDLDLNTVGFQGDLRRMFALGGEGHLGTRLQVRSGVRWNLKGTTRDPVLAVGMSVGLRQGFWLDGHYAVGRTDEDREFGIAIRAGS